MQAIHTQAMTGRDVNLGNPVYDADTKRVDGQISQTAILLDHDVSSLAVTIGLS